VEGALHRFVRLLRLHGIRVSTAEVIDAMHAVAQPSVLDEREVLRAALAVSLVKDRRDQATFDEGDLTDFTLSEEPGDVPEDGHSHGKPDDIKEFFKPEDMAQQFNLHQEANKIDIAALTDGIVLSNDTTDTAGEMARVQLSTDRMHNPGNPGELVASPGMQLDVELSVAEEIALLAWIDEQVDEIETATAPTTRRAPAWPPCARRSPRGWRGCPRPCATTSSS